LFVGVISDEPSQTALTAAAARAAHLIVDGAPTIFADTLTERILGEQAETFLSYQRNSGAHPILAGARAQAVVRSRFTEDHLADAVRRGVTQYVVLGAGLDSYAYRMEPTDRVQVFEVDHPATQQWKRTLLAAADIAIPDTVTFVPVDFETDSLAARLVAHGFDPSIPALVGWLGVTMYLTRSAIADTLAVIGGFAPGTEIVVDHMLPAELRDEAGDTYVELVSPVAAQRGEPWLTFLSPDEMSLLLKENGFTTVENVSQRDAIDAALWQRSDSIRPANLSYLAHATR
jgi:methyltransferase (TIGR00027 family)